MAQTESIVTTMESIILHWVDFLTESILRTIEFNVAYIKSIFTTIELGGFDQAGFVDNRVDPGDTGNTFFFSNNFELP